MSEHTESAPPTAPLTRAAARRRAEATSVPASSDAQPSAAAQAAVTRDPGDISRALDRHDRRIEWMDLLRGLAILLVILHHSTQIVAYRIDAAPEFFAFVSAFFAPFRMPMLMFLSGLLVAGSLHAPTGKYVWGKVRRILWPIVVWTLVYAGAEAVVGQVTYMPWELGFWNTYLWFMQFIFVYYLAALLLRWVPAWIMVIVPLAAAFALMFSLPADFELLQRFFYLMPFFFLGAFVERFWNDYARILSVPLAWGLAIVPLAVAVYSGLDDMWARHAGVEGGGGLWYDPWFAVPAMLGILILVRLAATLRSRRWMKPIEFVGRYSLIYYVAHYPVFAALGWLAMKAGIENAGIGLIVIFSATVAVSTVFALLGRRMPVSLLFELPRRLVRAPREGSATPSR